MVGRGGKSRARIDEAHLEAYDGVAVAGCIPSAYSISIAMRPARSKRSMERSRGHYACGGVDIMEGYTGQSLTHRTLVARMDVERVARSLLTAMPTPGMREASRRWLSRKGRPRRAVECSTAAP